MDENKLVELLGVVDFMDDGQVVMLADKLLDMGRENEAARWRMLVGLNPFTNKGRDWQAECEEQAAYIWLDHQDNLVEALLEEGNVPRRLWQVNNDAIREMLHEAAFECGLLSRNFDLQESADILDSVENEDDYGLWQGQEPQQAIATQAWFSLRREIESKIEEIYDEISNNEEIGQTLDDIQVIKERNEEFGEEYKTDALVERLRELVSQVIQGE